MKSFRIFAVAAAALAFLLAILGSWVRINGAGMTCPDWPLCHGSLVPLLQGGVVLEWSHRLVALVEGFVLLGALITGVRVRRQIPGVKPVLAVLGLIFAVQVVLGGLTVQLSNRPDSVVWHWATAMALLAALTVLAVFAVLRPQVMPRGGPAVTTLATAAFCAFVTMAAGADVSSSGAGLACPAFPGCSDHLWGIGPLQAAQMMHRLFAAVFVIAALVAAAVTARSTPNAAVRWAGLGIALTAVQIALGAANVLRQLPTLMREAHAANAAATFLAFVIAAAVAAVDATGSPRARMMDVVRGETVEATNLSGAH